ncbi:ATP-binding protein [Citroniella saccharovorans]|uniref:ATP-binding protein n=1 Tax=Citroniella saccharovorans TaxID=2053367 RepID=A0AAW9MYQ0_9FIRM|nr:ATP-binding protein [Citroniella saccharovorans]MEB3430033.1 ATP-binding protein [Citroniella saccharovorans]
MYIYRGKIKSDLTDVLFKVATIENHLKEYIEDREAFLDIKLIINELVINGCKHGNSLNPNKKLGIFIDLKEESIKIVVKDEGCGIPPECLKYDPLSVKPSGRGLKIVKELSDSFEIDNNRVIVYRNL